MSTDKIIIETKNLTKFYGRNVGIMDVSMSVKEGEIFGFIGPNGAGKSTTIRTLLSLIYKTSGEATIFGLDIHKHSTEILKDVGYLPSEVFYYDNMTARELLRYANSFYKHDFTPKINALADMLSLELDGKVRDMSLGNKKKVGIIQGLLHSPKLIIMDEPTSGLDPLAQKAFFSIIKDENKRGATVLFSSHILSEVQNICDRVAIIKDGSIVATREVDALAEFDYKIVKCKLETSVKTPVIEGAINQKEIDKGVVTFGYKGDCGELLSKLAALNPLDVTIEKPTLEDIFMHYYGDSDE